MCSRIGWKYQTCLISSDWIESKSEAKKSETVTSYSTRFSVESVSCNLQNSSDFPQLASTCSDCKIGGKSGQKLHCVFEALVVLKGYCSIAFEKKRSTCTKHYPKSLTRKLKGLKHIFWSKFTILVCSYTCLSFFIMTHVSQDSYRSTPHCKCNIVPGELPSKFTITEKSFIWSCFCDVNIKMYHQNTHKSKALE